MTFLYISRYNYNCWLDSFQNCEKVKKELTQLGYRLPSEEEMKAFLKDSSEGVNN